MLQGMRTLLAQSVKYGPISNDCEESKKILDALVVIKPFHPSIDSNVTVIDRPSIGRRASNDTHISSS
jgi:hypothetical protein